MCTNPLKFFDAFICLKLSESIASIFSYQLRYKESVLYIVIRIKWNVLKSNNVIILKGQENDSSLRRLDY